MESGRSDDAGEATDGDAIPATVPTPAPAPAPTPTRRLRLPVLNPADTAWVDAVLSAYPRPAFPQHTEWDASVAGFIRATPRVPRALGSPFRLLDRFGAVRIGPDGIGVDAARIPWEDVVEIRTQHAWASLSGEAIDVALERSLTLLPRVPGRRWAFRRVCEVVVSLTLAVTPRIDDQTDLLAGETPGIGDGGSPAPEVGAPGPPAGSPDRERGHGPRGRTVHEIVYRRRSGTRTVTAGPMSALIQLAFPEAVEVLAREAGARAIPVVHVPLTEGEIGPVARRAAMWRTSAERLRAGTAEAARWIASARPGGADSAWEEVDDPDEADAPGYASSGGT